MKAAVSSLVAALLFPILAAAQDFPSLHIGDTAAAALTAPAAFTVIDPAATETLRRQVAALDAAYFRFDPHVAAETETAFRSSFTSARGEFLTAFENKFGSNRVAAASATAEPFWQFCQNYRAAENVFPANPALLALWAAGDSGNAIADEFAAKLRAQAGQHIRAKNLPAELRTSPQIRLLAAPATALAEAEHAATEMPRAKLVPLDRARAELIAAFPAGQKNAAQFLAGLLTPNCTPEAGLSRQSRAHIAEAAISALHYDAGQVIVARGEAVTARTKLALDKAARLVAQQHAARRIVAAPAPTNPAPNPWPWLALTAVLPLAGVGAWQFATRRRTEIILPARAGRRANESENEWQRRALLAEQRADRATAIVRKGLVAQLAHALSHDLIRKLVSQRTELLDSHQQAAGEMEQLAARLEKLEGTRPKEYYEARIAELEKELASKSAENRALIQARIEIARKQMAEAQGRVDLN